jgi:hypothetical protein
MGSRNITSDVHAASLKDPSHFWAHQAQQLTWTSTPTSAFRKATKKLKDGSSHESWTWFPEGEISTSYNCIDRHVEAGNGDTTAIIWDSPVSGNKQKISYAELQQEVATLAGVLREEGVKRGDSCGSDWNIGYYPLGRYPCCGVWRLFGVFSCPANRSKQAKGHPHSILWYRRRKGAVVL